MAPKRVLYVEDNRENRILIKRILEVEGYKVDEAADGLTGVKLAMEKRPDIILLDINLPDIDGYEVTARLRKLNGAARVPIVALTANVMRGDREKSLAAGCDGYIQKPIDVDELPSQIESYLGDANGPRSGVGGQGKTNRPYKLNSRRPQISGKKHI